MEITRGCPVVKPLPGCTDSLRAAEITAQLRDAASAAAELQFGQVTKTKPKDLFVPSYVAFDRKAVRIKAWARQDGDLFRYFDIYYYLEDDSMSIFEPFRNNSGLIQGKTLRRQKLPKDNEGTMWNWRHLNVGVDFTAYGQTYHIYDCDPFTRSLVLLPILLTSEGIDVLPGETPPADPHVPIAPSEPRVVKPIDRRGQFQLYDQQVLRFWGVWDDREAQYGELRPVILLYYLADDTLEVLDVRQPNDGRDPFPKILRRQRMPHPNCEVLTDSFHRCYMELKQVPGMFQTVPPYNGWGSFEDSLQNCFKLYPARPHQNLTKAFFGDEKVLRYEAVLPLMESFTLLSAEYFGKIYFIVSVEETSGPAGDSIRWIREPQRRMCGQDSIWPADQSRRFHIYYYLYDDTLKVVERALPNCGRDTGVFLARQRVPNPRPSRMQSSGATPPVHYSQFDLYVGQVLEIFGRRFVITDADEYVLKYMEHHEDKYPDDAIEAHRRLVQEHKTKIPPPLLSGQHRYKKLGRDDFVELLRNSWSKERSAERCRERVNAFLEAHADKPQYVTRKDLRRWVRDADLPLDSAEALIELCGEPRGLADLVAFRAVLHDASLSYLPLSEGDTVHAWARSILERHGVFEARHRIQLFLERYKDQPNVVCTEDLRRWINECQMVVGDDVLEAVLVLVGVGQFRSNMNAFRSILSQVYNVIKSSI
ncbi:EFHC1 [Cordylochernes scorpioides]|uniref:EFHC1 n=1 Tax=Cordylochernes scorpioides TaxID=51811 RepID=A0ABY6LH93_9ARAC|nr:EFHC1 [Cordylochernes scorpioides]